ncbi:MAG: hypothetical protein QXS02_01535, partial [Candidatus Thermoplasmatota archaeon]
QTTTMFRTQEKFSERYTAELLGDIIDERLEKYARDVHTFFRSTHVRISGMYSSIFNDAPMGFSWVPFESMNPASLALQLIAAHRIDIERISVPLDVYQPESYILWYTYFSNKKMFKDYTLNPNEFNVVIPCKRNPPIISKIATWTENNLQDEIRRYHPELL